IITSTQSHISPLIPRDAPGLVWGLSTRRLLLRHVRPQLWAWLHSHQPVHNHISPKTSGRTGPRMGSVNTPATPTTRATSQQSQYPLWAWLHSHQPSNCSLWAWLHSHQPARHCKLTFNTFIYLRSLTVNPGSNYPTWSNGPVGPQPLNSDPTVSMNATWFRTLVLQVWSRSDGRIAHDRTVTKTLTLWTIQRSTRRHTRRQHMGVQSNIAMQENFQIESHPSSSS
ncbi:unnamed protein product, partial [Prunus brigantina]